MLETATEDNQKRALIFLREVGAIDNATHRQLNGLDVIRSSVDLRGLRDKDILLQKGKGRSTYYIPNPNFPFWNKQPDNHLVKLDEHPPEDLSTPVEDPSAPVNPSLVHQLPDELQDKIKKLPQRISYPALVENVILDLCRWKPLKSSELVGIIGRTEKYLLRNFITPLRESGKLEYISRDA